MDTQVYRRAQAYMQTKVIRLIKVYEFPSLTTTTLVSVAQVNTASTCKMTVGHRVDNIVTKRYLVHLVLML